MTANPTTDQILADFGTLLRNAERIMPMPPSARDDIAAFADRLTGALPNIGSDALGETLLHVADVYSEFATNDGRIPISAEAAVAVRMLAEVGLRLYLDDQRPVTP